MRQCTGGLRWQQSPILFASRGGESQARRSLLRFYHAGSRPTPLRLPSEHPSLLPLVLSSSNLRLSPFPHNSIVRHRVSTRKASDVCSDEEFVVPFYVSTLTFPECQPTGWLRPQVVEALKKDHETELRRNQRSPWQLQYASESDGVLLSVAFAPWINAGGQQQRTLHMERLVKEWRQEQLFADILRGWSDEAYPIYHHASGSSISVDSAVAFSIERASLPLFGFANFGCLLTAYFHSPESGKTMMWVPRRSRTKRTWPGRLDVTVGGGMGLGDTAMDTIIRECAEEASLQSKYVKNNVRPVGVLPFRNRSPAGWILPGLYYLFDLPLPSDGSIWPRTNVTDGEVESFELMDVDTVLRNLVDGVFKPSSALALVDFLIRHGHVTEESDPRFMDICLALKPEMNWPLPWAS